MRHLIAVALSLVACSTSPQVGGVEQASLFTGTTGSLTLASGVTNDWAGCSSGDICEIVGDAGGSTLAGVAWDAFYCPHQSLWLRNVGSAPVVVGHARGSNSDARDRVFTSTGLDVTLRTGDEMWLTCTYDYDNNQPRYWVERRPYQVATVSTPSRSLNSAFQPSALRPTLVTYSVKIESAISIAGGAAGRARLLSDASNPPTTIRAETSSGVTGTAVLGVAMTVTGGGAMTYEVPAGHYVEIDTAATIGSPTFTLAAQVEETR